MFASEAGAYPSGAPELAIPAHIAQGCESLPGTNAIAYLAN